MKKLTTLLLFAMLFVSGAWAESAIRLHAQYPLYNTKGKVTNSYIAVPSDNKTDWTSGDMIFMILDGGDDDKAFKATYDGSTWNFAEWYENGGMPDFKPEGGTVSFAMYGENLNLSTDKPSNYAPSKTVARTLTSYSSTRKIGDIMSTNSGTYTVSENGVVDIFLDFERPMAKIHIIGAYMGATQIRNHIEGTKPYGIDNANGTNANYNKAKTMTLNQIARYMPSTQTFRDVLNANNMSGTSNMVYVTRPEDYYKIDAVYYGTMEPDENGDVTIVMCENARIYSGIESNAALGKDGMVAYWRKFPGMSINPGENIYIYGPMSEEETHLWHAQGVYAEMNFIMTSIDVAENQVIYLKPYCRWKAPAPSDKTLTFEVSDPSVVTISEDGNTLYTHGLGTATISATTIDGYTTTMTVNVKEVPELIDTQYSSWGTSINTNYDVGWTFFNTTAVDLLVTSVAMMIPDGEGGYEEVASEGGLNLLARATSGTVSGTLKIKEEHVSMLPSSILRITYTYNEKPYTIDIPCNDGISISTTNFPDDNFRNWILSQSYGSDGWLTIEEMINVRSINVSAGSSYSSKNIKSLQGIEFFAWLTELSCNYNQLTTLDLSKNTMLESLTCGNNQLTSLDVSGCTALTFLNCRHNKLISLDVSGCTVLTRLYCNDNQLTALDVSGCTALTELSCWANQLTSINVSKNTALKTLLCSSETSPYTNQLTSLVLSKNNVLETLYCFNNQLTSLDVSGCTALTDLRCGDNQLTSLDVSKNTALTYLQCQCNQLTTLDVSKNTALTELSCWENQLGSLDVSKNTALTSLECSGNLLTSLDVSKNTALTDLGCANVYRGLSYPNGNNQIISLDVSKNTALKHLDCSGNQLTTLDVSKNTALTSMNCSGNQLTALDVSKNTALTTLYCANNQLTTLDLSKNIALNSLACHSNQIKDAAMDALVESLPNISSGTMRVIYNENEQNIMTTTQVDTAKAKGWKPMCGGSGSWYEYEGINPETAIAIDDVNFPDENFRNYLRGQRYGLDGFLTEEEIASVTTIGDWYIRGNNIKSLQGIEFFTALTSLFCPDNQLTALDVSQNTALTYLSCCNNQLTALDVSKNTMLTTLLCYNNQLTALDVSKNTMLTTLLCDDNQLTSLDVSGNTALTNLYCYSNRIKDAAMDALVESLPNASNGQMRVIYNENEQNIMTTKQVDAAKAKGWMPMYYGESESGYYTWLEYAGRNPALRGDVNGDGEVNIDDATFVSNIILGTEDATEAADVNGDGTVSMPDAMFIVNKILNGKFPDEE